MKQQLPLNVHWKDKGNTQWQWLWICQQWVLNCFMEQWHKTLCYSPPHSISKWESWTDMAQFTGDGTMLSIWLFSTQVLLGLRCLLCSISEEPCLPKTDWSNCLRDVKHIHRFGFPCTFYTEGRKQKLGTHGQHGTFLGIKPLNQWYYVLNSRTIAYWLHAIYIYTNILTILTSHLRLWTYWRSTNYTNANIASY